jgi:Mg-chelatase subunit ChlD
VEREGISVSHPSRFILIGTMNPEEGELRPQILDRFGISAQSNSIEDHEDRALILERNEEFSRDPYGFLSKYEEGLRKLKNRITVAKEILTGIEIEDYIYSIVSNTCSKLKVDGLRPDIVAIKAARAIAAYRGNKSIKKGDIELSLEYTLGHRTRRSGLEPPPSASEIKNAFEKADGGRKLELNLNINLPEVKELNLLPKGILNKIQRNRRVNLYLTLALSITMILAVAYNLETLRQLFTKSPSGGDIILLELLLGLLVTLILNFFFRKKKKDGVKSLVDMSELNIRTKGKLPSPSRNSSEGGSGFQATVRYDEDDTAINFGPKILNVLGPPKTPKQNVPEARRQRHRIKGRGSSSGRRTKIISSSSRGRYAWYTMPKGKPRDIAMVPTIRAAALRKMGGVEDQLGFFIKPEDIRVKVREYSAPYTIMLLVDMSLSMISSVENIIQTIYSLHTEVYRRRDRIGLIVFKGSKAFTLQHPTRNLDLVVKKLREVGASDYTPMAAGLFQAWKVLKQEKLRNKDSISYLYIISDGIANVPLDEPLSPLTRRRYTSEAQADSFDVAHLLVKEDFNIHIFNTNHSKDEAESLPIMDGDKRIKLTPTQFLMHLSHITKGRYIGMKIKKKKINNKANNPAICKK